MSYITLLRETYDYYDTVDTLAESKAEAIQMLTFKKKLELVKAAGLLDTSDKQLMTSLMADVRNSIRSDIDFIHALIDFIAPDQNCFDKYLSELIYENDLL
jgi:hypothetical protein